MQQTNQAEQVDQGTMGSGELQQRVVMDHLHSTEYDYKLAFPLVSNGNAATASPAAMNRAPLVYTGAAVFKLANIPTIGYKSELSVNVQWSGMVWDGLGSGWKVGFEM